MRKKEILQYFICPITQQPIGEAVLAADGFIYEKSAMERWIQTCQRSGQEVRSPCTNLPLRTLELRPLLQLNKFLQMVSVATAEEETEQDSADDAVLRATLEIAQQELATMREMLDIARVAEESAQEKVYNLLRQMQEERETFQRVKEQLEQLREQQKMREDQPGKVTPESNHQENLSVASADQVSHIDMGEKLNVSLTEIADVIYQNPALQSIRLGNYRVADTLPAHYEWVTALTVLPDNTFLSGAKSSIEPKKRDLSAIGDIKLWSLPRISDCIKIFRGHETHVWRIVISPDGKSFASASEDHTVRIWKLDAMPKVTNVVDACEILQGHSAGVVALTYLPDNLLASGSRDKKILIWNLNGTGRIRILNGHNSTVYGLVSLPGKRLASSAEDGKIRIWDLEKDTCVRELNDHTALTYALTITPDSRYLVSGSDDNTVRLWEIDNAFACRVLIGHKHYVNTFAFLNNNTLISGSDDKTLKLWSLETGACVQTLPTNSNWIWAVAVLASGDILSGDTKGVITHWQKALVDLSFRVYLKRRCRIEKRDATVYLHQPEEDISEEEVRFFSEALNFLAMVAGADTRLNLIRIEFVNRTIRGFVFQEGSEADLVMKLIEALKNVDERHFQRASYATNRYMVRSPIYVEQKGTTPPRRESPSSREGHGEAAAAADLSAPGVAPS